MYHVYIYVCTYVSLQKLAEKIYICNLTLKNHPFGDHILKIWVDDKFTLHANPTSATISGKSDDCLCSDIVADGIGDFAGYNIYINYKLN